ncbi:MAG: MarR family winged helix-turn-helix transcriptional regulator [Enterococcus viikkiensis]|uniref:MarR family transcriptional regulator n=1 Tax=Enterococcus viikkiensis TaxID=930854 RepID=A0ABU3FRE1_9ENTE|nr:MarR family transcriptional regulator [Enterococcus viikkiensis]MDT2828237.1 MarR family transcriptional regulator [Enterococcus viikkiensis]
MKRNYFDQWIEFTKKQKQIEEQLESKLKEDSQLTLNEYYVLYYLNESERGKMRLSDLEKKLFLSQSAMSRLISRMENKNCGVIQRSCCEDDKRGMYLSITSKGMNTLASASVLVDHILKNELK